MEQMRCGQRILPGMQVGGKLTCSAILQVFGNIVKHPVRLSNADQVHQCAPQSRSTSLHLLPILKTLLRPVHTVIYLQ